jgi:inner membrane protein
MNDPTGNASRPPALPSFAPAPESQASRLLRRARPSLKLLTLLFLLLLLLIPLAKIRGVLHERRARQGEAIRDITDAWGGQQVLAGPVLIVPYRYTFTTQRAETVNGVLTSVEHRETAVAEAYFLPEQFDAQGELSPEVRYRGIYEAVVYKGRFTVSGHFRRPSFEEWKIPPQDVLWEEAVVSMSLTDLRGVQEGLRLTLGGRDLPLVPGSRLPGFPSGVQARVRDPDLAGPETIPFSMSFSLNGSVGVRFAPVGIGNTVKVSSAWSDPSFQGAYLPVSSDIRADGFSADWAMSYYGRAYPQQWTSQKADRAGESAILGSLFGVDLLSLVDQYRNVERSIKYGSLFLLLVFTGFFLFETLGGVRIHPFQYILVGAALCLFYLALLSLSELTAFRWAYLAGAAASTLLIALYCARVLRGGRRALVIAAELVLIYGFLYVILQLQDYSLLIGTAGLFVALGAVMFLTRKINWYEAGEGPGAGSASRP